MITPDPTELFILVTEKNHTQKRYARFCYLVCCWFATSGCKTHRSGMICGFIVSSFCGMLKKVWVVAKVCKRGFWLQIEISRAIAKKLHCLVDCRWNKLSR
jgi:hypothetical protein